LQSQTEASFKQVVASPLFGCDPVEGLDTNAGIHASSLNQLREAVTELFKAVRCALREDRDAAELFVGRAASLLKVDSIDDFAAKTQALPRPDPAARSGLAPWQVRRVKTHIEANLAAKITTQDLAGIAGLSPFHFSRAFRDSFGDSPHRYLLHRRMELSQGLMLTTKSTLADIALECGLVDQAHFGKLFRRLVGVTPGAWRRARATEDSQSLASFPRESALCA
jgi:AraC-like DNA-binding protein